MKDKKILYICIAIIIVVLLFYKFFNADSKKNSAILQPSRQNTLEKQTSEGNVTVDVTPQTVAPGSQAIFEIQLDTHSVDLNYDLATIAELSDDKGQIYKPVSWTGGKGGHHLEGRLTFPEVETSVKKVTLSIPNIDSKDRIFSWDVK